MFIINFPSVSESVDCICVLREFGFSIFVQQPSLLPLSIPTEYNFLPSFPDNDKLCRGEEIAENPSLVDLSHFVQSEDESSLRDLVRVIQRDPTYSHLVKRIQSILSSDS